MKKLLIVVLLFIATRADAIAFFTQQELDSMLKGLTAKGSYLATAYDLSYKSTGKRPGHKHYGITSSGYSLRDKTREDALTVATDPSIITPGTMMLVVVPKPFERYTGIYYARDTGKKIRGRRIDIHFGVECRPECLAFGKRRVQVFVISTPTKYLWKRMEGKSGVIVGD